MMEPERMIAHHAIARQSWLRAAALRVNGGIVATAGLVIGVAACALGEGEVLVAGTAGLVAGALALAVAEYSLSAGRAEPPRGGGEGAGEDDPVAHHRSGLAEDLVGTGGGGLADFGSGHGIQLAITSAGAYALGGALPLAAASAFKLAAMPLGVGLVSLGGTALLAAAGARAAGLPSGHGMVRATSLAAAVMAAAFAFGRIVGTALISG